jgi:autotransporter-associated beta strand protein
MDDITYLRCGYYYSNNSREVFLKNVRLDIGHNGLKVSSYSKGYRGYRIYFNVTIGATASYSIFSDIPKYSRFIFYKENPRLTFDTENPDNGIGHIIRNNVVIQDDSESSGGMLIKKGKGVLVLSAGGSTFAGGTIISNGVISAEATNCLGSGKVDVREDAKLQISAGVSLNNDVLLDSGAAIDVDVGKNVSPLMRSLVASQGAALIINGLFDKDDLRNGTNIVLSSICDVETLKNLVIVNNLAFTSGKQLGFAKFAVSNGQLLLSIPGTAGMSVIIR